MSRWLIAMSGTVGDTVTGEHEDKTQEEKINNLSEQLDKNDEVIELKKSFDEKENNPEKRGTGIEIAISEVGNGVKD